MPPNFVGVDVGTGSARAGVFTADGRLLGRAEAPITTWQPAPLHVEQSSDEIWSACCAAVRAAVAAAGCDAGSLAGIAFDATCSLVALDGADRPVSVSTTGRDEQNVVVWMDHRAVDEAAHITSTGGAPLAYVGDVMSPEMQTPKLLWLRRHLPDAWARAARFLDLPDFLVYRATGDDRRSMCSAVCKWTYLGERRAWDAGFFEAIGLGDLVEEGFARIGREVVDVGVPMGSGLAEEAAAALGLPAGLPVSSSIIDAHAGALGLLGIDADAAADAGGPLPVGRLALVFGTSACHLTVSAGAIAVPGVWGPYFAALLPDAFLAEGGISAAGALLDHLVASHPAGVMATAAAGRADRSVFDVLNDRLDALAGGEPPGVLTRHRHVLPYHLGNRSPLADPSLSGTATGLSLTTDVDDLALSYLAAVQSLAYGTRHIVETLVAEGHEVRTILMTGSGMHNRLLVAEHADATGLPVVLPAEADSVLLGAAVLAGVASGHHPSIGAGMRRMARPGAVVEPRPGLGAYHDAKYAVYRRMHADQLAYRAIMDGTSGVGGAPTAVGG